jgi:23S rRNA pseudouridine1911/1915/1917 synthase
MPEMSRSRLKALIEDGRVSQSSGEVRDPSRKIRAGEVFRLAIPPAEPAEPEAEEIALTVVYEDDDLIVIDKPAGMVVHPAPGNGSATLVNALLHHCSSSLSGIGGVRRPGIVHRLDKDTSGLLVAAKTDAAHHGLALQFAEHSITRAYRAVCWGVPMPRHGEVVGNIGRSTSNRKKMAVVERGGKYALTRYAVQKAFGDAAALIECRLETGRTHQIRVHMASIGHPLVGDPVYGGGTSRRGKGLTPEIRQNLIGFPRQALHAFQLGFSHPISRQYLEFDSDTPKDFNDLIYSLEPV